MITHRCPGCRAVDVPDKWLACTPCWMALPQDVRNEIGATARLPLLHDRRRRALMAAGEAWQARVATSPEAL